MKFNTDFDIGLPTVISSFRLEKTTADGLSMQTGIGQGDTLTSPLHMAMIAQSIYNGGEMQKPSFIEGIRNHANTYYREEPVQSLGSVMTQGEAYTLKQMMRGVILNGTAQSLSDLPYEICGKTGTAQFDSPEGYTHSWFVGFSNTGNNDIVTAVLIEEAGEGEAPALQVARSVFEGWFAQ